MKPFVLTRKARSDLTAIARFTEQQWGREQRNQYLKQLDDAFYFLAADPLVGKTCDDIRMGYRKFPQGSHLIFYRTGQHHCVEIIRILHKHRDTPALFDDL